MSLISAHGLFKAYGAKKVLDGVSLTIEAGDRLGLIGINGAGKSTLIRLLLGLEEADAGEIQRKRGLTVQSIEQAPRLDASLTVREHVHRGLEHNLAVRRRLEAVNARLHDTTDEAALGALIEEQSRLSEELEHTGGWNIEHRAEAAMLALSVPPGDRRIEGLSQGELRRVALCAGLLSQPDLLVLDEPTNHIDVRAIEWLENTLVSYPGGLILVTHDRYFLDRVANRHAELDRGDLRLYEGNYSEYLAAKAEREAMEAKIEHKRQRSIENELQWVRRRAPARTTKQKARLDRFDALVASRPKTVATEPSFRLPHPPRIGKTILELQGVSKSLGGKKLVEQLDLILKKGDRLGIVGPNGAGKTTLLRMILGELEPDEGVLLRGHNTSIAYADQRRILDEENTVLEEVSGESEYVYVGDEPVSVHGFLNGLLFDNAAQRTKISALSGGERSRVALAKALRVTANLLILDEPTNDLDLPTLRVLEDALIEYPGCALIVSHDRYFLDRVTTGLLVFEGNGKLVLYEGASAHEMMAKHDTSGAAQTGALPAPPVATPAPAAAPAAAREQKKQKLGYREQQELATMEQKILDAEARVAALEQEVFDPEAARKLGSTMPAKLAALEAEKANVEKLYARWADLSARNQG